MGEGERMTLTLWNRLALCIEILTIRSGHAHAANEKELTTFMRGYTAGMRDAQLEREGT
jgi:hypothetical protein